MLPETIKEFSPSKDHGLIELIRAGLPFETLQSTAQAFEISEKALTAIVGLSSRTLQRQKKIENKKLSPAQSEHILYLRDLFNLGTHYFGDKEIMREWLQEPSIAFGGETPLSYCDTITGIKQVSDTINKLAYGMTA